MDLSKNPPDGIGQCLNATYELRSQNEKSVFLLEDQLCFYAKNWFFSQKSPKFEFFSFFEQIRVMRYCPKWPGINPGTPVEYVSDYTAGRGHFISHYTWSEFLYFTWVSGSLPGIRIK